MREYIIKLYQAILNKDKKLIESLRNDLEFLGCEVYTQNILLKEIHKKGGKI